MIEIGKEMFVFIWKKKLWWMIPLFGFLLIFALLILFLAINGEGPSMYALY